MTVAVDPYRERPALVPGAAVWTRTAEGGEYRILPDGCMDLLFIDDDLVVAGPDSRAWTGTAERGTRYAGIRFAPGAAPDFLGVPARELLNERVPLADLWSPARSQRLRDRIGSAPDPAVALDEAVATLAKTPPDGLITEVLSAIRAGVLRGGGRLADGGNLAGRETHGDGGTLANGAALGDHGTLADRGVLGDGEALAGGGTLASRRSLAGRAGGGGVSAVGGGTGAGVGKPFGGIGGAGVWGLASRVGLSERQLHRRCLEAFGYGPKMLDRVLRMNVALDLARTGLALADVAVLHGYADQAHFTRDVKALTGVPPKVLLG